MATAHAETDDMEARIARLESDVAHIRSDVGDLKADVRSLRDKVDGLRDKMDARFERLDSSLASAKLWAVALYVALAGSLFGTLARGFGWI